MKTYLSIAVVILLATSAASIAAPNDAALEAKEKSAWEAFKDKKADDFKKVVAENIVAVYPEAISNMQTELADMQKWDMKSFAISDYKVTWTGTDTAVTSYTVKLDGTYNGQDMSGTYNAASVWKEQNGQWMAIFHTNIKQEVPAKTGS